ncbi:MAG: lipopolysaccharide biosynthesis protein [Acidimicrobiales bacterium]
MVERSWGRGKSEGRSRFVVGFVASQALGVVSATLVARSLSVADRGRLGLLVALASVVALLATLGIPGGLLYHASRESPRTPISWSSLWRLIGVQLAVAALASVGIVAGVGTSEGPRLAVILVAASVAPLTYAANAVALLLGLNRNDLYVRALLISTAAWVVVVVAFAFAHVNSLQAFGAGWLGATLAGTLYTAVVLHGRRGPWTRHTPHADVPVAEVVRFGATALIGLVPPSEVLTTELLLATLVLGPVDRGLFVVATSFRLPGRVLGDALSTHAAPAHARLDRLQQRDHGRRLLLVGTAIAVAGATLGVLAAPTLTTLVFGAKYAGARRASQLLAVAGGIAVVSKILRGLRLGEGKAGLTSISELVTLAMLALALLIPAHWTLDRFVAIILLAEVVRTVTVVFSRGATVRSRSMPALPHPPSGLG